MELVHNFFIFIFVYYFFVYLSCRFLCVSFVLCSFEGVKLFKTSVTYQSLGESIELLGLLPFCCLGLFFLNFWAHNSKAQKLLGVDPVIL